MPVTCKRSVHEIHHAKRKQPSVLSLRISVLFLHVISQSNVFLRTKKEAFSCGLRMWLCPGQSPACLLTVASRGLWPPSRAGAGKLSRLLQTGRCQPLEHVPAELLRPDFCHVILDGVPGSHPAHTCKADALLCVPLGSLKIFNRLLEIKSHTRQFTCLKCDSH